MFQRSTLLVVCTMLGATACTTTGTGNGTGNGGDGAETQNLVTVEASEFAFSVSEGGQAGVVTLRATNGGSQLHHFLMAKVEEGRTKEDLAAALGGGQPPEWIEQMGGIETLDPGSSVTVTRDLDAGSYAFVCFLPSPADEMQPHVALGMYELFKLTGTSEATNPEADATFTIGEDALGAPETVSAGTVVFQVTNDRTDSDQVFFLRSRDGGSMEDIDAWFESGMEGPSPVFWDGGVSLNGGEAAYLEMELEAGATYTVVTDQNHTAQITVT